MPIINFQSCRKRVIFHTEKFIVRLVALILTAAFALAARAADHVFESSPQRAHLLELFTSQGCSSCPPAEAWLSKLKNEPRLWKDFVPLAFHVDYWDRLGWRDPFAAREWTARQYQHAERWRTESVYTPGFVLDGREWLERRVPSVSAETPGRLKLSIANQKIVAEFISTEGGTRDVDLHVATLGFDLTTKIAAGENSGRSLHQDFIVLSLTNEKMSGGKAEIPFNADRRAGAIAAWITAPNQLGPIQAVGGWFR
jgi:hypothetical protein